MYTMIGKRSYRGHVRDFRRNVSIRILLYGAAVGLGIFCALPTQAEDESPADRVAAGNLFQPPVEVTIEPAAADSPTITVGGIVVDAQNQPVPLATIVLRANISNSNHFYNHAMPHNRDIIARTRSDKAGRFRFNQVRLPLRLASIVFNNSRSVGAELIAWANGRAIVWREVNTERAEDNVRLVLQPEAKVFGVLHDPQGKPIAGAAIQLTGVTRAEREYDAFFLSAGDLRLVRSEAEFLATTDADGKFELQHLPANHRLITDIRCPGFGRQFACIDTGSDTGQTVIRARGGGGGETPLMRSPIELSLEPKRHVIVRASDERGPITSGGILVLNDKRQMAGAAPVGANGEAQIEVREPGKLTFIYSPDPFQPVMGMSVTREIAGDGNDPPIKIVLPAFRWLTGRVVDEVTGVGVGGAYIAATSSDDRLGAPYSIAVTAADGKLRIPVLPGQVRLRISVDLFGFLPIRNQAGGQNPDLLKIEVPADGEIKPVTIPLSPGLIIRGVLRDKDGAAVVNALVHANNIDPPFTRGTARTDADGNYRLAGLSPQAHAVVIASDESSAARVVIPPNLKLPAGATREVDPALTLGELPVLTGRILKYGKPQPSVGITLQGSIPQQPNMHILFMHVRTDDDGRYCVAGVAAGDEYNIEINASDGSTAPNWHYQMPYVQNVPAGQPIVELPDAMLVSCNQTLRGQVVDPQGKPVQGVTVSASVARDQGGMMLPRVGPPPWADTGEQGKFEIVGLPDQAIEIMVYRRNPQGGPIRHPAHAHPTHNQQDIRIVYDPALEHEIEDLDAPGKP